MDEQKLKDKLPRTKNQMMFCGLKPLLFMYCAVARDACREGYRVWDFPPYSRGMDRQTITKRRKMKVRTVFRIIACRDNFKF